MTIQEFHANVMPLPHEYIIFDTITRQHSEQVWPPMLHELQTYQPTGRPNEFELKQTKECYIDTRYQAKMRLYEYLRKRFGIPFPGYMPFSDPEIGKSKPILTF